MDIFYLLHGSNGDPRVLAQEMQPLFDDWIAIGKMKPMLVVFPTYYPDSSFIVPNYPEDYPLNHFFATTEISRLMEVVETIYSTFAVSGRPHDLKASRNHRAFGGYSMGGVTTWDVLIEQTDYFYYYMPMEDIAKNYFKRKLSME